MTFPGGAPGGYPGQGPQQPVPGPYGQPPSGGGMKLGLPQIAHLITAGLGLIIFFVAFASIADVRTARTASRSSSSKSVSAGSPCSCSPPVC